MNKANECTCPSGDGSLVHPCPAHPAVEQAGGDERAAFEAWMTWLMDHVYGRLPDFTLDDGSGAHYVNADVSYAWTAWQARAAMAQPYPKSGDYSDQSWINAGCPPEQPEQAEAERPEVVGYRSKESGMVYEQDYGLKNPEALTTVAECERIVGTLRAENAKLSEALDECDGDRWKLRSERDAANARLHEVATACATAEQQRDAALARVAELERQEPAGWLAYHFGGKRHGTVYGGPCGTKEEIERYIQQVERSDDSITLQGKPFYAAPAAQAQHSVPGDIMRDAQRYRWLRDQQFYFSFSTENSDAGISSCTAGMSSRFKNLSWVDAAIDSAIAAAPGKEGV